MLIINNVLDKHAPFKEQAKRKEKLRFKPCITKGILTFIKQKNKIYKEMIKAKNSQTKQIKLNLYKKYRNIIVDLLKKSKESHYRKYFEDNKRICKAVWNRFNEIIYSKSKVDAWEPNFQPKDIADYFNDYFTSVSKKLQKHIPPTKRNFSNNLKNPNVESLFMTLTTSVRIKALDLTVYPHQS